MSTLHHTKDAQCPMCEDKLKTADPELADWFHEMKKQFPQIHISCSWRGKTEQDKAFAEGKSKLKFPESPHNKAYPDGKPCSQALDIFALTQEGEAIFPKALYQKLWQVSKKDYAMIWGGNFQSIGDANHFQLA